MMLPIALAGMVLGRDSGTMFGCDARASGNGVEAWLLLM